MGSRFHNKLLTVSAFLLVISLNTLASEPDSNYSTINKCRLIGVSATAGAIYAGSMVGLYQLWYKDYASSGFHFFNDFGQWYSMDKIGHATTSYWVGRIGYESLRWSGLREKQAVWFGGTWGLLFLTTIEIFDGFSDEWGASAGDMAANLAGAALFIGQQLGWKNQPFLLKFSFHPTEYAEYRPDLLGSNMAQQVIKDYNGQTYWLSANIASFINKPSRFPGWINLAFGYSAEGMLGASENPPEYDGKPLPLYERYPQYFLTMDIDLTRIKTRSETVRLLLNLIGFIKIPFPALEYNPNEKLKFHWLYF